MSDTAGDGASWAAALDVDALLDGKGVAREDRVGILWRLLAADYANRALAAGETAEDAAAALATDAGDAAVTAAEVVRGVDARIAGRIALDGLDPRSGRGQADEDDETVDDVPWSAWRAAEDLAFKMMATGEDASRTVAGLALGRVLAGFWARFAVDQSLPPTDERGPATPFPSGASRPRPCGTDDRSRDHGGAPGSSMAPTAIGGPGQALPEVAAAAVRRHAEGAAHLAADLVRRHQALHQESDDA